MMIKNSLIILLSLSLCACNYVTDEQIKSGLELCNDHGGIEKLYLVEIGRTDVICKDNVSISKINGNSK